jgi:signal transduction histidine kinase
LAARRQVFLFFKETLTNIVRHSRATRVELSARIERGQLHLEIFDNGCGFDPGHSPRGLGLANQEKRAGAIGASVRIISAAGQGTRVCLAVPLHHKRKRLFARQCLPLNS